MVSTYQTVIRCEVLREKVFRGERTPTVLGHPGNWLPLLIEATRLLAAGEPDRAAALRDAAFNAAEPMAAKVNSVPCEWLADADPRLGPTLEIIIDGRYAWVPYEHIRLLELEQPVDLRDQVWMPARVTFANEGATVCFIPTRYPDTTSSNDPALLLARRTEWREQGAWSIPLGQRMLVSDVSETALMDLRELRIEPIAAGSES
jgi:type VI secretion system protein ImpE